MHSRFPTNPLYLCGGLILLLAPRAASADTWAVVVGVDKYQRDSVTSLRFAGADAHLFSSSLEATGVRPDHIYLYSSDSPPERRPTRANLVLKLEQLASQVGPKDTFIFYFAGHGINVEGGTFLMTEEADPRSLGTVKVTSLEGRQLVKLVEKAQAGNSLVVLDACRNDPTRGRGDQENRLDDTALVNLTPSNATSQERTFATLFACSTGERSYEAEDLKHGYFTYWLTEGLRKAANADGRVTLQTVYAYLQKEVPAATQRDLGKSQLPVLKYEGPNPNGWTLAKLKTTRPPANAKAAYGKAAASGNKELFDRVAQLEQQKTALMKEHQLLVYEDARLLATLSALGANEMANTNTMKEPGASHLGRARSLMFSTKYSQASAELSESLKAGAETYPARLLRGIARQKVGDQRGSIEDLNLAIHADANFWPAFWFRALAREGLKDLEGAKADCTSVVGLYPKCIQAFRKRAHLRLNTGDTGGAAADTRKAEELEQEKKQ